MIRVYLSCRYQNGGTKTDIREVGVEIVFLKNRPSTCIINKFSYICIIIHFGVRFLDKLALNTKPVPNQFRNYTFNYQKIIFDSPTCKREPVPEVCGVWA